MLKINIPNVCVNECAYILDVVISDVLGLEFEVDVHCGSNIEIYLDGSNKKLIVNSEFFAKAGNGWLNPNTMPEMPLKSWDISKEKINFKLLDSNIPVLYGEPEIIQNKNLVYIGVDLFGSAFFLLSRYEELVSLYRDEHNRFPASASIAYKENFLDRPIVNEYIDIFWACIHDNWPDLERKKRKFRKLISCDVDHPFDPARDSILRTIRRIGARVIRDRNVKLAVCDGLNYVFRKIGSSKFDEYHKNIDWMIGVNNRAGNTVVFNFIPLQTSKRFEDDNDINDEKMVSILKHVEKHGHQIGFHPGYNTYKQEIFFCKSAEKFLYIMRCGGFKEISFGGRQHYLRYDISLTPSLWQKYGFLYDSTLGYPDHPGFRSGFCYEYSMYDLVARKKMKIKQRPLIVMENSILLHHNIRKESIEFFVSRFSYYEEICKKYNGDFTMLWHNSSFDNVKSKAIYEKVI